MAYMQSRGPGCFDNRYYLQQNPDLQVIPSVLELWDHFVMMGQFEGRSFRYDHLGSSSAISGVRVSCPLTAGLSSLRKISVNDLSFLNNWDSLHFVLGMRYCQSKWAQIGY